MAESLELLASAALGLQSPDQAVRLAGAADALRESLGTPLAPAEQKDFDALLARIRAALSAERFAAGWEEGRAMTWEQAAAYALLETASIR